MIKLKEIVDMVEALDVRSLWKTSTHMTTVSYHIDVQPEGWKSYRAYQHYNDRSGARRKRGVYRHVDIIGKVWYVGKAVESKSTIGMRQSSHLGNFRGTNYNESSGSSYRFYMGEQGVDSIEFNIEYLDLSDFPPYMIDMIEKKTIEVFKPCCNQQST